MAFFHAGDPQPYSPSDLALVKRFPIVQFDKKQGLATMPGASTEERARGTTWQDSLPHLAVPPPGRGRRVTSKANSGAWLDI